MLFVVAAIFAFIYAILFAAALCLDIFKCLKRRSFLADILIDLFLLFGIGCTFWVSGQIVITNIFG